MDYIYLGLLALPGLAITCGVWFVWNLCSELPTEDRSYLDRPPLGFRLAWPLINLFSYYLGGLISSNYHYGIQLRLQKAGKEYTVSVPQFFASKLVSCLVAAVGITLLLSNLENPSWSFVMVAAMAGYFYPEIWLKETIDSRNQQIFRTLPFFLDIITLSVESGTNLTNGIHQAVLKAPDGPLRDELSRFLRDVRAGKARSEALRDLAGRADSDGLSAAVSSMIQAEKTGASLGPVLRAQANQIRSARFLKAEKLAMEAPVKLLGPLILFIFPNTFLVLGFVILSKSISAGVITWAPLVWAFTHPG